MGRYYTEAERLFREYTTLCELANGVHDLDAHYSALMTLIYLGVLGRWIDKGEISHKNEFMDVWARTIDALGLPERAA